MKTSVKKSAAGRTSKPAPRTGRAPRSGLPRAWVVTADMGLGHQRAAWPLRDLAQGGIMTLGRESNTDPAEHTQWERLRRSYEFLSRTKSWPIIGNMVFGMLDRLQNIPAFYPIRDMSNPSFQVTWLKGLISKGMCRGMLETIGAEPLPLVTTFYAPAIAADMEGYSRIYCVICDAEVNRVWVAENPRKSRIVYLVPSGRTVGRLKEYGVPDERIWVTGFPMPIEVLGDHTLSVLRHDMGERLHRLDTGSRFWPLHRNEAEHFLGAANCRPPRDRTLRITFGIGGAGAQTDIAHAMAHSLRNRIVKGEVRLTILAGIRPEVARFVRQLKKELELPQVEVVFGDTLEEYFASFTACMRTTDILWTKPSELSFYSGLGIPIIIAPPIGSQELYNQNWLVEIQAGYPQGDPRYTDQWLFHLLEGGRLADAAWDGFLKARKYGTYKIREIVAHGTMERESSVLRR
jgi:hypothetical protein